jgi:uncharacterized metal-binding protein
MMEEMKAGCDCDCGCDADTKCVTNDAPTRVYACAGASNVGIISMDLTIALHKAGKYKMGCSVCVGAGDCGCGSTVTPDGRKDLLIDGCKVSCLKKMFEKKGITEFNHIIVTQLGVAKEPTFEYAPSTIDTLITKLTDKGL